MWIKNRDFSYTNVHNNPVEKTAANIFACFLHKQARWLCFNNIAEIFNSLRRVHCAVVHHNKVTDDRRN